MSRRGQLTLVLGGARAGKSSFAEELARRSGERVLFIATAEAGDEEMRQRIQVHRASRPQHWQTVEAPIEVFQAIGRTDRDIRVVLLDCLTLLTANIMGRCDVGDQNGDELFNQAKRRLDQELEALLGWLCRTDAHLIVVSNEVGLGLVPSHPMGRAYRDLLGWANQMLARYADEVYLVVAGLPLEVKGLVREPWKAANGQA